MTARPRLGTGLRVLLSTAVLAVATPEAFALILGGTGNTPIHDPGWPKGAAAVFNVPERIAYWEGPPFGGGQWHAECRGDATALGAILADFAKIDAKTKRLVLHDGVGQSFWLNTNREAAKRDAARMDWMFMVWQPASWQRQRRLPADIDATDRKDKDGPPVQIEVYTGGSFKWADVVVPKGLTIVDERMEAHGFSPADGVVLEGKVTDVATGKPIAATVILQRIEYPQKGGYTYSTAATVKADAAGHWVVKKAPAGQLQVVVEAPGYVSRIVGWLKVDDQPRWQSYDAALARAAVVAGRVHDDAGQPLPDVEVRVQDVTVGSGENYQSALGTVKTGPDGRFRADQVPVGKATVWVHKNGYCRPGLGQPITTPKDDLDLTMIQAGRIVVTVDFTGTVKPGGYIVNLEPEGGSKVGTYGGSGQINAKNQMIFENVPPGRYVLKGRPNPGAANQETDPITIDLKGGKTAKITLTAGPAAR